MSKFVLLIILAVISTQTTFASSLSRYFNQGAIYSNSSFPVDAAKNTEDNIIPVEGLKCGEATTNNILGLVETGNRGIQTAAENGGITKIHYVDTKVSKVYIPLFFIPIYVKQTKTLVYGE